MSTQHLGAPPVRQHVRTPERVLVMLTCDWGLRGSSQVSKQMTLKGSIYSSASLSPLPLSMKPEA